MTDSPEHTSATESAREVLLRCDRIEESKRLYDDGEASTNERNGASPKDTIKKEGCVNDASAPSEATNAEIDILRKSLVQIQENASIKHSRLEAEYESLKLELANVRLELEQANLQLRKSNAEREELRRNLETVINSKADMAQMMSDENYDMFQSLDALRLERDEVRRENAQLKNWIVRNPDQTFIGASSSFAGSGGASQPPVIGDCRRKNFRSWSERLGTSTPNFRRGTSNESASRSSSHRPGPDLFTLQEV